MKSPASLIRPLLRAMEPYEPGEQPKIRGLVKLNTNENPYPPSPRVLTAVRRAADGRLRLYPNPTAQPLRDALARFHRCRPEQVFVGNGADECLALAVRAFVEPRTPGRQADGRTILQYFTPSYSLYPVLADAHGAVRHPVPLLADFRIPPAEELARRGRWLQDAALSIITTPNAPSGRAYDTADLEAICRGQRGVVMLDETYVDFAGQHALGLALKYPHVTVVRTFSKAYSLCGLRVGYVIGHSELVAALDTIRDSYNVNTLGQVAALATLRDLAYYRGTFRKIVRTRTRLASELATLGFQVLPSQTNFLFARPPKFPARVWLQRLRDRRVLVRWFSAPEVRDYLRISIGTDREVAVLMRAVRAVLSARRQPRA